MWIAKTRESLTFWTHLACLGLFPNTCFIEYGSNSTQQASLFAGQWNFAHTWVVVLCLLIFTIYLSIRLSLTNRQTVSIAIYVCTCTVVRYCILYCIVSQHICVRVSMTLLMLFATHYMHAMYGTIAFTTNNQTDSYACISMIWCLHGVHWHDKTLLLRRVVLCCVMLHCVVHIMIYLFNQISDKAKRPAEFKHITKQRKRN